MEIRTSRKDCSVLVFSLEGRLDGQGSGELDAARRRELGDDDRAAVVDMRGVPYLSSAGIRSLLALAKELKRRNGILAIAGATEYPVKVLDMAGFLSVFPLYPSVDEAVAACVKVTGRPLVIEDIRHPPLVADGARFDLDRGAPGPATLHVTGDIRTAGRGPVADDAIRVRKLSEIQYSLGTGAMAEDIRKAVPALGEMITVHGAMVWQPANGTGVPDFIVPQNDTGEIRAFTAFTASLHGPFHDIVTVESDRQDGIRLSAIYRTIFANAGKNRAGFSGIAAIALWGVTAGIATGDGPEPSAGTGLRYSGNTLMAFGYGIDRSRDLSRFDPAALARICPVSRGENDPVFLHNHGLIFRNIPWDPMTDFYRQIRHLVFEEEFVDMQHLSGATRIRRAKAGVSYIGEIRTDD